MRTVVPPTRSGRIRRSTPVRFSAPERWAVPHFGDLRDPARVAAGRRRTLPAVRSRSGPTSPRTGATIRRGGDGHRPGPLPPVHSNPHRANESGPFAGWDLGGGAPISFRQCRQDEAEGNAGENRGAAGLLEGRVQTRFSGGIQLKPARSSPAMRSSGVATPIVTACRATPRPGIQLAQAMPEETEVARGCAAVSKELLPQPNTTPRAIASSNSVRLRY